MAAKRILITGGSGFVGQWVCRHYLARGFAVFAGSAGQATGPAILTDEQRKSVEWLTLDTTIEGQIAAAVDRAAPDYVVHLAAMAFSPDSTDAPTKAFDVNALGAMRVLTSIAKAGSKQTRILIVGSAEQYGANSASVSPVPETVPLAPLTMYAATKATQELVALQFTRTHAMQVVCTRSFNHSGFGHGPRYLFPALVDRARQLPKKGGTLSMGNTTPVRDYSHVADVVAAYAALLERGTAGEVYNVSSGSGIAVGEIAERVLARMGTTAEITSDAGLTRPVDVPVLIGDNSKLRKATGWTPRYTVDDILDDLIHGKTR